MSEELGMLIVGKPYEEGLDFGSKNGFEYKYSNGQFMLLIFMPGLSASEIKFFNRPMDLGLFMRGDSMFLMHAIEGFMDWSDQPFSINYLPESDRGVEPSDGTHMLMPVVLVESQSGVVAGMRAVTYSKHMSALLTSALRRQKEVGLTREQHEANVLQVYEEFPLTKLMVSSAQCIERAGVTDGSPSAGPQDHRGVM